MFFSSICENIKSFEHLNIVCLHVELIYFLGEIDFSLCEIERMFFLTYGTKQTLTRVFTGGKK